MSRIGKAPIEIPAGVTVKVDANNVVTVKGPKGELSQAVNPEFEVKIEDGHIHIVRPTDDREHRAQHGLYRALVHNMNCIRRAVLLALLTSDTADLTRCHHRLALLG